MGISAQQHVAILTVKQQIEQDQQDQQDQQVQQVQQKREEFPSSKNEEENGTNYNKNDDNYQSCPITTCNFSSSSSSETSGNCNGNCNNNGCILRNALYRGNNKIIVRIWKNDSSWWNLHRATGTTNTTGTTYNPHKDPIHDVCCTPIPIHNPTPSNDTNTRNKNYDKKKKKKKEIPSSLIAFAKYDFNETCFYQKNNKKKKIHMNNPKQQQQGTINY